MDAAQVFNLFEAVFWVLLAAAAAWRGQQTTGFTPLRRTALVLFLISFGLSDIWEIYSGAWWQPKALLLLKAVCLSGLIATAGIIYCSRWRSKRTEFCPPTPIKSRNQFGPG